MAGKGYMFGSENMVLDNRPYFFMLFLDGFNMTENLRIPSQFKKHILQDLPHSSKAILKGPSGEAKHVRVVKTDDNFFLKDGWKKFVRDNLLGNNEFMLFTYEGNLRFNVQIFAANGLERVSMSNPQEDQHPIASDEAGPSHFRQPRELKGSTKEGCFEEKGKKKPTERNSREERNIDVYAGANHKSSKRKTNLKEKTVKSFTSNHPYFEVRLNLYNIEKYLHIPKAFSQKYLPFEKTMVVLRNDQKKKKIWEVNSLPYAHGHSFHGGWVAFARDNNLKENDVCIFELVGPLEMKMHILRSGSHP